MRQELEGRERSARQGKGLLEGLGRHFSRDSRKNVFCAEIGTSRRVWGATFVGQGIRLLENMFCG